MSKRTIKRDGVTVENDSLPIPNRLDKPIECVPLTEQDTQILVWAKSMPVCGSQVREVVMSYDPFTFRTTVTVLFG